MGCLRISIYSNKEGAARAAPSRFNGQTVAPISSCRLRLHAVPGEHRAYFRVGGRDRYAHERERRDAARLQRRGVERRHGGRDRLRRLCDLRRR